MKFTRIFIMALLALSMVGCASHKGSSSFGDGNKKSVMTPRVKSDEQIAKEKAEAERLAAEAVQKAQEAAQKAQEAAAKVKADAEAKAKKAEEAAAKAAAETKAKVKSEAEAVRGKVEEVSDNLKNMSSEMSAKVEAEAAKVKIREEKVTMVGGSVAKGHYHVIVGTYSKLENANAACDRVTEQGFKPSVMENAEGLYRVAVFSADNEATARTWIAAFKIKYPAYADSWLMLQK